LGISASVWLVLAAAAWADGFAPQLEAIKRVGKEGQGHRQASAAWAALAASAEGDQLPEILAALDDAGPLAANWLRAAVDAIAERQLQRDGKLPQAALEAFLSDTSHHPRARRLAYEWIARADPKAPDRLIPKMLDDPSIELRRDAVARVLTAAETALANSQNDVALAEYRRALAAARDLDQVKVVSDALAKLGHPVDLPHHFGFIVDWKLIGPFPSSKGKGYDAAFPPESAVNFQGQYDGSAGKVQWISHHTDDEYGNVDLNKALGKHMGVAGYAAAEFYSQRGGPVDLRLGSTNAIKIWLNGKLLASAESYHTNSAMDQYIGRGELKPGRNIILLKICQNEQTEEWAQDWKFQFRVCDSLGAAIHSTDRPGPSVARKPSGDKTPTE
jgi:hypothetical protein